MKPESPELALANAVIETFAELAFIDVIKIDKSDTPISYSQILHIDFLDPHPGSMALFLPLSLKKKIVENVFANNFESLRRSDIDDCLLELLNVLGGNFLNRYYGVDIEHSLSLPHILFDEEEILYKENFTEYYFNAEGEYFKVPLYFSQTRSHI